LQFELTASIIIVWTRAQTDKHMIYHTGCFFLDR